MRIVERAGATGFLVVVLGGVGAGCAPERPLPSNAPNILIVTLDTVRADHVSCYGYPRETTPVLDRLAVEGQRLKNFTAVSSWTLPSHASLFTGLFPSSHGAHYSGDARRSLGDAVGGRDFYELFRANRLPEKAVCLAEVLRRHGYATGGVGAGPWLKSMFGLSQGFDWYDADTNSLRGRPGEEVNELAIRFLRKHRDEPFFLFVNYFDAHDPYSPPPDLRFKFFDPAGTDQISTDPERAREYEISQYDAEIFLVDRHLGVLLEALEDLGIYEDTWIMVISDHGEQFGEHGIERHGFSLFEPEIRGVFVQKPPADLDVLRDENERCQHVDIMPTILSELGIEHQLEMEGQPLGSLDHPVIAELFRNAGNIRWKGPRFDRDLRAIYSDRLKLIRSTRQGDRDSGLFDLDQDPDERHDLSLDRPDQKNKLLRRLVEWEQSRPAPLSGSRVPLVDSETVEQLRALGYLP